MTTAPRCRLLCLVLPVLAVAFLSSPSPAGAQSRTGFVQRVFKDDDGAHRYTVYVPKNYSPRYRWPVVLFLHGAAERGTDGMRPSVVGLGPMIRRNPDAFPYIVVFPQAENLQSRVLHGWYADGADGKRAMKILADAEKQYNTNPKHRILAGWSMGGSGVWSLAASNPDHWAGLVSLSGGGDPKFAAKLKDVPAWAFHGKGDAAVAVDATGRMVDAVNEAGGRAKLTVVDNIGHDAWKFAFDYKPLLDWMWDPKPPPADAPATVSATDAQRRIATDVHLLPFVPAIEVSRAASVRLGNDALKSLSYALPNMVKPEMLSGRIRDIHDRTVTSGRTFNVQFTGVGYSAKLHRANVEAVGKDKLRMQFALQNVTLSISRTYVTGTSKSATAGLIQVVVGHRRPVWLTVDVKPRVADGKLKLQTLGSHFEIPRGNWYVTRPAGVRTSGFGMTEDRVSDSLVEGLYGSKTRIETEVRSVVPAMVRELEKQLNLPDEAGGLVERIWPLPVYPPRIRLKPESVRTDENGVTLSLKVVVAAVHPDQGPKRPRQVDAGLEPPASQKDGRGLHLAFAPNLLQHLSQVLVDGKVAQINIEDVPNGAFAELSDRRAMESVLPELVRLDPTVRLQTELFLMKPISLRVERGATTMRFEEGLLRFSTSDDSAEAAGGPERWKPFAECSLTLSQPLVFSLKKDGFSGRRLIAELEPPEMEVTVPSDGAKIDGDALRERFLKGWNSWARRGLTASANVPDLKLGGTALRLASIQTEADYVSATFAAPGVRITNASDQTLTYQARGGTTGWGGPYTLKPGEHHEFPVAYSMIFRRRAGNRYESFTLPAGSHSRFRPPTTAGEPSLFLAK